MEEHSVSMKAKEKRYWTFRSLSPTPTNVSLEKLKRIANENWNYSLKLRRFGGNARNSKKWPMNSC